MIKENVDPKYNYEDIAKALKDRVMLLTEVKDMIDFFNEVKEYSIDLYTNKKARNRNNIHRIFIHDITSTRFLTSIRNKELCSSSCWLRSMGKHNSRNRIN